MTPPFLELTEVVLDLEWDCENVEEVFVLGATVAVSARELFECAEDVGALVKIPVFVAFEANDDMANVDMLLVVALLGAVLYMSPAYAPSS